MNSGSGRGVAALTGAICAIAVVVYASNVPRNPISLIASPAAADQPMAARPATPATASEPDVNLSVVVWPRGPGHARHAWSLRCPPLTAACRAAAGHARMLADEGHGRCGRIRPGAGEAMITGYLNGHYVEAWLDQRDACALRRWRALRALTSPPRAPVPAVTARGADLRNRS